MWESQEQSSPERFRGPLPELALIAAAVLAITGGIMLAAIAMALANAVAS
jgi:hypothetical protein